MRLASGVSRAIAWGMRALTGAQARWIGCGPSRTQRIYFVNHTSHCDFLLVLASLPSGLREGIRPVACADYWGRCALRRYLANDVFHTVSIDRSGTQRAANPLEGVMGALDRGASILFFPEGTRGAGEGLQPLKQGIFYIAAARPDIELVPVWVDNAYRVMPKGSWLPLPLLCTITFGEPVRLRKHEDKEAFLKRLYRCLADLADQGNT